VYDVPAELADLLLSGKAGYCAGVGKARRKSGRPLGDAAASLEVRVAYTTFWETLGKARTNVLPELKASAVASWDRAMYKLAERNRHPGSRRADSDPESE